jgi:tetratricopeptide (TPR) repeat protein
LILLWRNRPLGFLGAWFFAILAPTFVIPIFTEIAAERRMYLTLIVPVVILVIYGFQILIAVSNRFQVSPRGETGPTRPVVTIAIPVLVLAMMFCLIDARRLAAFDSELSLWLDVLQVQPDDVMGKQYLGARLEAAGDEAAAEEQYRDVIRLDTKGIQATAAHAHYQLGMMLLRHGKTDEGLSHLSAASELTPGNSIRANYAYALLSAGRYDAAIAEFHKVLHSDPKNFPALKNLGAALEKSKNHSEAIQAYKDALEANPSAIEVYGDLARCYLAAGDKQQAISMYRRGAESATAAGNAELAGKFEAALQAVP